jgi:hypothetical protein
MKAENGRVFRDRKIDPTKSLDIVRHLNELDDIRVRTRLKQRCKQKGSTVDIPSPNSLPTCSGIETPSCKLVTKWYESESLFLCEKKKFTVPEGYIRAAQEKQKHPQASQGLEYDLDEEDEAWLSEKSGKLARRVGEEDLEKMLIRLEFALHATTSHKEQTESEDKNGEGENKKATSSASACLPQESAIAVLAADGFSHLVYQDLALVYKYWVGKRDRAKKPLLRCLQPPPALDESNPYDLFCGQYTKNRYRSPSSSSKSKAKHESGHSFWQPKPNVDLTIPKALQHFKESFLPAKSVTVMSGKLTGRLLEGLRHQQEYVSYHGRLMHPSEFEFMGAGESHRNWKAALRVKNQGSNLESSTSTSGSGGGSSEAGEPGLSVGEWLRIRGKQLGNDVLGKIVSIYNKKLNMFKSGIIEDFDRINGQHHVRYLDGLEEEWLHLPMERVRWLPGSSLDFGIRVLKKVRKRTPMRSHLKCNNIHSKDGAVGLKFFNSRKALQFQLATVQGWFRNILQSALNFAAARMQPVTAFPLKRGEFNGLAKLGSKKGKALLKWAPGYAKGKGQSEEGQNPEILPVLVGDLEGHLVSGCSQRQEMILFEGKEVSPEDFVRKSGEYLWPSWTNVIQVRMKDDSPGPSVGDWLRARGHEVGATVVSKGVGVYRPEVGTFQWGNVVAFDRLSGKHLIQYEDGLREWLFLSLHFIKWVSSTVGERKKRKTNTGAMGGSVSKRLRFV